MNLNFDTNFRRQVFRNNFPNSGQTIIMPTLERGGYDVDNNNEHHNNNNNDNDDDNNISADEGDVSVADELQATPPAANIPNVDDDNNDDLDEEAERNAEEEFDDFNMQEILGLQGAEVAYLFGSRSSVEQRVRDIVYPRVEIMVYATQDFFYCSDTNKTVF